MTTAIKAAALLGRGRDPSDLSAARSVEPLDTHVLVLSRCVLAAAALAIVMIDPSELDRHADQTYLSVALSIYFVFSIGIAIVSWRHNWPPTPRALHWIDVAVYAFLILLSGGAASPFFLYFFYAVLNASFSTGFREGALVVAAALGFFVLTTALAWGAEHDVEVGRAALRAVYLVVFGYAISYLGGHERLLRGRLALLKDMNDVWSPRFGVDHLYGVNLDLLRKFYGGNSCILVLRRPLPSPHYVMYNAVYGKPGRSATPSNVSEGAANALMSLPDTIAAFYHQPTGTWRQRLRGYLAVDTELKAATNSFQEECAAWANLLDARALVTVPYVERDGVVGRLFVTATHRTFSRGDIDFLMQVTSSMLTVVENMSLVEELASQAAEQERRMISRDIHDTTIQPYIGLKLALDALFREAGEDNVLSKRIGELIEMAEMTVRDLRNFATTLKGPVPIPGQFLVSAVKNQAERMKRFYGIDVEVEHFVSPELKGRLAGEAFQIISEGLSNILRHSTAKKAFVHVLCEDARLLLKIGDGPTEARSGKATFLPRSIDERARMLGGRTFVEVERDGYTVVSVTIPFST